MDELVWGHAAIQKLARAEGRRERSSEDEAQRLVAHHQLLSAERTRGFAAAGQCGGHTPPGLCEAEGLRALFLGRVTQ